MKPTLFIVAVFLLASCAPLPQDHVTNTLSIYVTQKDASTISTFAPVFITENPGADYNKIGTPSVIITKEQQKEILVNSHAPSVYVEKRVFATEKKSYTNLIYRLHFSEIPDRLFPFQIGAGKNIGLFVVITLNNKNLPILYTTVHTCGCYLAFIPTSYMPDEAFPPGWPQGRQRVYGQNLPALLDFKTSNIQNSHVIILLQDISHRIKDMRLAGQGELDGYTLIETKTKPLDVLEKLPDHDGQTISFYDTTGVRKGYVVGSHKLWEQLFISWWAFDWRVGEDKKLGVKQDDSPVFYTSLKPWAREESDMRDFAAFLTYWGWKL